VLASDNTPNSYFGTGTTTLTGRKARWAEFLSGYNYHWVYRPGVINAADQLSRVIPERMADATAACIAITTAAAADGTDKDGAPDITYDFGKHFIVNAAKDLAANVIAAQKFDDYCSKLYASRKKSVQKLWMIRDTAYYFDNRLVVHPHAREYVMQSFHDATYAGHKGVGETYRAVSTHYWWPGMYRMVHAYVTQCPNCQRNKPHAVPKAKLQPLPVPADRFDDISLDFVVGLPATDRGHNAILTIIDRLTKFVTFIPCSDETSAADFAALFRDHWFCRFGLPLNIVCDRDPRFTSHFWQQLAKHLSVRTAMSTAFHPQTDGQTERVHRVLEDYLRSYVCQQYDDWDMWLALAAFAHNNSKHSATGHTPFYLTYGRHPRTPATMHTRSTIPAADEFSTHFSTMVKAAMSAADAARQRMSAMTASNRPNVYEPGQLVLLSTKNLTLKTLGPNKLLPRWVGPFKVLSKVGEVAYKLDLPDCMKIHPVFHVSLLYPYKKDHRTGDAPEAIYVAEEGDLYHIDCVLEHKKVRNQIKYLVQWTGYGPEHNSWVSYVTPDALTEYWEKHNAAAGPTPHTSQGAPQTRSRKRRTVAFAELPPPLRPKVSSY
jgi:hypothetical protein